MEEDKNLIRVNAYDSDSYSFSVLYILYVINEH